MDPELAEFYVNFAYGELIEQSEDLDTHDRLMTHLAVLIACGSENMYMVMLEAALNVGVTPIEIKEILYQASAYVGMGRVYDFLHITNNELLRRDEKLPLAGQATTTPETRKAEGERLQRAILGDQVVDTLRANTAPDMHHMLNYISDNVFGDLYSRTGIGRPMRELLTLSMLVALGGCESQLRSHIAANINVGNSRAKMVTCVTQLLPIIGYPRTLNGLRVIAETATD